MFADLATYGSGRQINLLLEGGAKEVRELQVTGNFFDLLGLQPTAGRMFTEADVEAGRQLGVLSHATWTRLFARDPAVIGRSVQLDHPWSGGSALVTIVGVASPGFAADWSLDRASADIFTVLRNPVAYPAVRVIGRLRAGATREAAEARMSDVVARAIREVYPLLPDERLPAGARVASLHEELYGDARPLVRLLLAAGALLVLIGCASAAATLVTMASRRARDVAIQQALGRRVGDLRRSVLLEGLCLGLLAGVAALVAGRVLVGAVVVLGPASMPRIAAMQLGWFEAGVAGLLAAACGLIAALIPAVAVVVRPDAFDAMREGATATVTRATLQWRQGLLAVQVAVVLALLVTAGLMLDTLHTLATTPLGFSVDDVLVAEFRVPDEIRTDEDRSRVFVERVLAAAGTATGARAVALTSDVPLSGVLGDRRVYVTESGPGPWTTHIRVGPGYFDILGIPILAGHDLTAYDGASNAVLVNASFAREHYGTPAAALGRRLWWDSRANAPAEVIGVVGDTRPRGQRHAMPPVLYVPLIADRAGAPLHGSLRLLTREQGDPVLAITPLRAALQAVDPRLAVHVEPLAIRFREEIAEERLLALSLAVLGGSTLLLSVFGIAALVGQLVTDRSRELALRLALGSSHTAILCLMMRGVLVPALAGTGAGLILAWWGVGLIRQFLFETPPYDVTLWALAVASLLVAALAGAWWPARRALCLDPAQVLRQE